jgi:hypothetical protein
MLSFNPTYRQSYKVWIYTAAKPFSENQLSGIAQLSQAFLNQWESHGTPVRGGIEVVYDHFLVIIADDCDGHLCGRAQDAQVRLVKEIEEFTNCSLLNRMLVGYRDNAGEVRVASLHEINTVIQSTEEPEKMIVFDNTVTNYGDFVTRWETALENTWLNRLLPTPHQ